MLKSPLLILGDGAFPLRTWIMKSHVDAVLPDDKRHFNFKHSHAWLVIEGAFGRLKGGFPVFIKNAKARKI